jgi:hypothetical protein
MKRIVLRSIVLTLTIVLALAIANVLRRNLDKPIGTGINQWELIAIGVLTLIITLLIFGDWVVQRKKISQSKKKPKN